MIRKLAIPDRDSETEDILEFTLNLQSTIYYANETAAKNCGHSTTAIFFFQSFQFIIVTESFHAQLSL